MKTRRDLEKLLTSAGLLALGAGFVLLGFLSFLNRPPDDADHSLFFNAAYPIIGSLTSVLLGSIFLAIAVLFIATYLQRRRSVEGR
jgi:hypothetical protein